MKSSVNKRSVVEATHFPAMYQSRDNKTIVLFTSEITGTVIYKGNGNHNIGHTSDCWIPCKDVNWERLNKGDQVIIEQE